MNYTATIERSTRTHIDWSNPSSVKRHGIETPSKSKLVSADSNGVVVFSIPGRSYNPGSRHSMLKSYAPAETEVWLVVERTSPTSGWALSITSWNNNPKAR